MKILERTFDLINNSGQVYTLSLLSHHTGFFYSVEGLGTERDTTYQKIGETYDILRDEFAQGKISGMVFFHTKRPYHEYMRFVQFCQDTPLRIHYRTPVDDYYRDGMVSQIEKNEDGETARAKITFTASTLWYRDVSAARTGTYVEIESDSNMPSPCCICITPSSTITSLVWNHYVDNVFVSDGGKINYNSLTSNDTVYIRTDKNPYELYYITSGYTTQHNIYSYSDFSTKRFVYLQKGLNKISCSQAGSMSIEAKIYYETV